LRVKAREKGYSVSFYIEDGQLEDIGKDRFLPGPFLNPFRKTSNG